MVVVAARSGAPLDAAYRQHFLVTLARWPPSIVLLPPSSTLTHTHCNSSREEAVVGRAECGAAAPAERLATVSSALLLLCFLWLFSLVRTELWTVGRSALKLLSSILDWLPPPLTCEDDNGGDGRDRRREKLLLVLDRSMTSIAVAGTAPLLSTPLLLAPPRPAAPGCADFPACSAPEAAGGLLAGCLDPRAAGLLAG